MKNNILSVLSLVLLSLSAWSQTADQPVKQIDEKTQLWVGYFNQTRLTNKWGVWTDVQLRTKEELIQDLSQGVVRVGLMYYLNDNTKLTAGYAFMNHFPNEGHANISRPEHRPWQQIQWHTNGPRSQVSQRLRLEERFRRKLRNDSELGEGYAYTTRIRYNLQAAFPLTRRGFTPGGVSLVLNDELHVNLGKKIVYNYFDQNRFFVGLGFHLSRTTTLQTGYMNLFQQLPAGNQYRNLHTARIYLYQNLDLRKPKG